jgi:hypothetical protein
MQAFHRKDRPTQSGGLNFNHLVCNISDLKCPHAAHSVAVDFYLSVHGNFYFAGFFIFE